ncbi:hypothetical protein Tco_0842692 [Tanacetum coccineum]|uniref:Integrase, catalytic region, zinc finger, CCHC-type, peptidase aspartic, catalytic n=1 Tax=Tanacetum coccineum TaxID=301880 RepID=A0ABQ5B0H1_9ASTR
MDPMISLGQKNTLAEYMILSGTNNRPPMLDKDLYDSWKSRMELYMQNREHGRMILESVENGPLIWPTVEENELLRFMGESSITDARYIFDKAGKRALPPECSKFMTDVKLVKDLHTSNFDQLHAYLEQHEIYVNEVRFTVLVFSPGDDPITCLNKAMAFLTAVASSRQCTQPKQPRNAAWYKEKAMLAKAQEAGQILDEEQLTFLADPRIPTDQAQKIIPHNAAFQNEDLDTYDLDCNDLSTA